MEKENIIASNNVIGELRNFLPTQSNRVKPPLVMVDGVVYNIPKLLEGNASERIEAARVIGKARLKEYLPELIGLLRCDRSDVVRVALESWSKLVDKDIKGWFNKADKETKQRVIELVKQNAKSGDWGQKYGAAKLIGSLELIECLSELIELCCDWNNDVRNAALETAEKYRKDWFNKADEETKQRVIELVKENASSWNSGQRYRVVELIGSLELIECLPELVDLMLDRDDNTAEKAREALDKLEESLHRMDKDIDKLLEKSKSKEEALAKIGQIAEKVKKKKLSLKNQIKRSIKESVLKDLDSTPVLLPMYLQTYAFGNTLALAALMVGGILATKWNWRLFLDYLETAGYGLMIFIGIASAPIALMFDSDFIKLKTLTGSVRYLTKMEKKLKKAKDKITQPTKRSRFFQFLKLKKRNHFPVSK